MALASECNAQPERLPSVVRPEPLASHLPVVFFSCFFVIIPTTLLVDITHLTSEICIFFVFVIIFFVLIKPSFLRDILRS